MKFYLPIATALLLLFLSNTSFAQKRIAKYESKEEIIDDNELRILSWNIQMLPRMLFRISRGPIRRSKLIPQHIIDDQVDIIVFQEAFDPRARRILRKGLEDTYPYMVGPANPAGFRLKTNSGIWMLSKIPIKQLSTIDFRDCERDDCLARKGALLVEAVWDGVTFQVLGTHLEAGGPDSIKRKQYREIRGLIDEYRKDDVPQFLCGDFNTSINNGNLYADMLRTLDSEDSVVCSELKFTDDPVRNDMNASPGKGEPDCDLIDYALFRSNGYKPDLLNRYVRQYQERWCEKYKDLSDHNAVLVRVVMNNSNKPKTSN